VKVHLINGGRIQPPVHKQPEESLESLDFLCSNATPCARKCILCAGLLEKWVGLIIFIPSEIATGKCCVAFPPLLRPSSTSIYKCTLSSSRRFNFSPSHHFSSLLSRSLCSPFCFCSAEALDSRCLLTVFFHASFILLPRRSRMQEPSLPPPIQVEAPLFVEFWFWLPRLPPRALGLTATGAGDGDSESALPILALFSALLSQSSNHPIPRPPFPCTEKPYGRPSVGWSSRRSSPVFRLPCDVKRARHDGFTFARCRPTSCIDCVGPLAQILCLDHGLAEHRKTIRIWPVVGSPFGFELTQVRP